MAKLNGDILFSIFEELQEDSKSLFSCLMINRFWCETAIPILWKNPWRYNILNDYNKNSLYSIITSYLPDDVKEFLTSIKIFIPTLQQSLLFDYLSFCKSIDVDTLNSITSLRTSNSYDQFLLQHEIYSLLVRKCSELKYLNIESIEHQFYHLPEAKAHFKSLCELKCDTSIDSPYFYGLARICQYIQRLIITNKKMKVNNGLVKLIENQRNLKYFELKDDFEDDNIVKEPYKEIFSALTKKADILNHLIMSLDVFGHNEHAIAQDLLTKFHKLKTLIIHDVSISFSEDQLKMLKYPELETFNIDFISISDASIIIENSGGHLREISLRFEGHGDWFFESEHNSDHNDEFLIFICKIYKNCPLIEHLSLLFLSTMEHFIEFEKLLIICQKLKSLLLVIINNDKKTTGKKLLKILTKSAPTNLREIRFFEDFKFSLKDLEKFFKNWKDRPALSILTSDPLYRGEDYVELINKYKNNGIIKDFRYDSERNIYY
jgi:hypothetical protein